MSNEKQVLLPSIGDFSDVEIIEVLVSAGDTIEAESPIITLESDKAAMEIPAPEGGTVKEVKVSVGDKITEGDLILILEPAAEGGEEPATEPEPPKAEAPTKAPEPPAPKPAPSQPAPPRMPGEKERTGPPVRGSITEFAAPSKGHASPSVRRFARELGVDILQVQATGPKNRVTKEDVQGFVKRTVANAGQGQAAGPFRLPPLPEVDFSLFGDTETKPLGRIKRLSGAHLHNCWLNIPHVTQFDEADISEMEAFRKSMKDEAAKQELRLTPMPFVMKATVAALQQMPEFNSSLAPDGENLVYKRYFHLGIAVDTPNGLVVPVIRDVDQKGVYQLAKELGEMSDRARKGKLGSDEMRGGCFTISSLGGIGGTGFTPIVNAPEVAILGLSKAQMKPVWNGQEFEPKLMLPFSVSYDHRVIDGAQGVRFTTLLAKLLGDMRRMLL